MFIRHFKKDENSKQIGRQSQKKRLKKRIVGVLDEKPHFYRQKIFDNK
jgi:hypothetical protein